MRALIAALLLCAATANAQPWDSTDKALAAVAFTALAVDWGQTLHIAKNPDQWTERNPILGAHPSVGRVNAYFIAASVGTYLIADGLKPEYRKAFLATIAVLEIGVTARNRSLGVRIQF